MRSWIIIDKDFAVLKHHKIDERRIVATLPPMHPGEMLREEFLQPMGISAGYLAKACGVPRTRIERLAKEQIGVSGDTALRLAKALNTTPQFWLNLQKDFELATARASIGDEVDHIKSVRQKAA